MTTRLQPAPVLANLAWRVSSLIHLALYPPGFFERLYNLAWYRQTLADWLAWLAPPPGARLLEVGCSSGGFSMDLARRDYVVTGVDRSWRAIRHAKRRRASADVGFVFGDALQLPLPSSSYDYTLAASLLNVVNEPLALLAEMARVTTGNGVVSVLFPTSTMQRDNANRFIQTRGLRGFSVAALRLWADFANKLDINAVCDLFQRAGLGTPHSTTLFDGMLGAVYAKRV